MHNIFIERKGKNRPSFNMGQIMGKDGTKGDVGIEIEVEGRHLLHDSEVPNPWAYHHDGSLRGQENAEYVLKQPIPFSAVNAALKTLWTGFKKKKAVFDDSNRTSVHIHLNCQRFHLNRLTAFLSLYFALEEILTDWCGEYRVGNLFCLRAIDAPGIVTWIKRFIEQDGSLNLPEGLHYSGLNLSALKKYGSVEIRTLRGTSDPAVIATWVSILERLYTFSADFPDPREICTTVSSGGGPLAFFDMVLGPMARVLRSDLDLTDQDIRDKIYTGIRLAQDISYCKDWSRFNPIDLKEDPFNRKLSNVAKKMAAVSVPIPSVLGAGLIPGEGLSQIQFNSHSMATDFSAFIETQAGTQIQQEFPPEFDEGPF